MRPGHVDQRHAFQSAMVCVLSRTLGFDGIVNSSIKVLLTPLLFFLPQTWGGSWNADRNCAHNRCWNNTPQTCNKWAFPICNMLLCSVHTCIQGFACETSRIFFFFLTRIIRRTVRDEICTHSKCIHSYNSMKTLFILVLVWVIHVSVL